MKRVLTLTFAMLALVAFVVAPATSFAGPSCGAKSKTGDTKLVSAKHCAGKDKAACAAKLGLTPEECKELCAIEGHEFVKLSIEGMTCGGCEKSITACLEEIPGVVKVGKVSHKDGTAFVVINTKLVEEAVLATVVTKKGYKAEVIPAVAITDASTSKMVSSTSKAGCGMAGDHACTKSCAKACGAKGKAEAKTDKADETKKTSSASGTK